MKTLLLSDIHSNIYALEAIWKVERDSDLIYCAGDLVDYGPYPQEVLHWIRSHHVPCVQGNHDAWVAKNYRDRTGEEIPVEERSWVHHNANLLNDDDIAYLEQLPQALTFDVDENTYCMTHMYQGYEEIVSIHAYQQFINQIGAADGSADGAANSKRLILGHTHRQAVRYLADDRLWVNPGSVSYRRKDDPDQTAHYAVIVDGVISLRRLAYDLTPLRTYVENVVEDVSLKATEAAVAKRFFGLRHA